jgi:glycosyltransferase involved in cell wall biosynthesis
VGNSIAARRPGASRVCHITSVHSPGDVRIFHKECASLAAAGFDTHLLAPRAPEGQDRGVHLHPLGIARSGRLERMTVIAWGALRAALAVDADLYHFHDPELIPVGLVLRQRGRQVIYDVHEDLPQTMMAKEYLPRPARAVMRDTLDRIELRAARSFSAIVTATPTLADRFRGLACPVRTVNNYPLLEELCPAAPRAWSERDNAVGYVGWIAHERGIIEMVNAMEIAGGQLGARLELGGQFSPPEQRLAVEGLPGWHYVVENGQLQRAGVAGLLGRVRAGLVVLRPVPRFVVSRPVKFFEYMAAGIPVIASDFPEWRTLLTRHDCGLVVDPLSPDAIADAIHTVLTRSDLAEAMGRRGRRAVEDHYNWAAESRTLVALYEELLGRRTAARAS